MNTKMLDLYITHYILKPQYRRYDIEGAPYKIDTKVIILDNPSKDDTFDVEFIGKEGVIVFFEYDCGCGQTYPDDPMIGVEFNDGRVAEFWKDEILIA
ncbi:hypothetical protein [Spirosoma sp.]|uniref:hypothetical protein n=1 Tax=Spirosoma sp. TaxID=1899569 RepID=UPI00262F6D94|nr:hypothetical protein [Spirosoma sp.]MCX6214301.1 hypothetical protein [Spirosoma sp.]